MESENINLFDLPLAEDEQAEDRPAFDSSVYLESLAFGKSEKTPKKKKSLFRKNSTKVQCLTASTQSSSIEEVPSSDSVGARRRKPKSTNHVLEARKLFSYEKISKNLKRFRKHWTHIGQELWLSAKVMLIGRNSCQSGFIFIALGFVAAFIAEIVPRGPRYNIIVFLALLVAEKFPDFPLRSVRPQIVISLLVGLSLVLDVIYVIISSGETQQALSTLVSLSAVGKIYALFNFLSHARGTLRARKYLIRRFRLFAFPTVLPKRMMRDIRARILAIGWIQFLSSIAYAALFIASITAFEYSVYVIASARGVTVSLFLLLKTVTSLAVFVGVFADSNVVLCLSYFGCLGCAMQYVKDYIRAFKHKFGGWPYPYAFNMTRFQMLTIAKAIDVAWGIAGWVVVGQTFGKKFYSMESGLRGMLGVLIVLLFTTDVWTPLLFAYIYWMIRKYDRMVARNEVVDSDDSELDEFEVRKTRGGSRTGGKKDSSSTLGKASSKKYPQWAIDDSGEDSEHDSDDDDENDDDDDEEDDDEEEEGDSEALEQFRHGSRKRAAPLMKNYARTMPVSMDVETGNGNTIDVVFDGEDSNSDDVDDKDNPFLDPSFMNDDNESRADTGNVHNNKNNGIDSRFSPQRPVRPGIFQTRRQGGGYEADGDQTPMPPPAVPGDLPQRQFVPESPNIHKTRRSVDGHASVGETTENPMSKSLVQLAGPSADGFYLVSTDNTSNDVKHSLVLSTTHLQSSRDGDIGALTSPGVWIGPPKSITTSVPRALFQSMELETTSSDEKLIFDPTSSIQASAFGNLWASLKTSGNFSCEVSLSPNTSSSSGNGDSIDNVLSAHLQSLGFQLVSSKITSQSSRMFFFVCGYCMSYRVDISTDVQPVYCLLEVQLAPSSAKKGVFTMVCNIRTTDHSKAAMFVQELSLADVLELQ